MSSQSPSGDWKKTRYRTRSSFGMIFNCFSLNDTVRGSCSQGCHTGPYGDRTCGQDLEKYADGGDSHAEG